MKKYNVWIEFIKGKETVRISKELNAEDYSMAVALAKRIMENLAESKGFVECDYGIFQPSKFNSATYDVSEDKE